jgi:hypothetical protein
MTYTRRSFLRLVSIFALGWYAPTPAHAPTVARWGRATWGRELWGNGQ